MRDDELGELAERAETAYTLQYTAGAPAPIRSALGMAHDRIGGGIAVSVPHAPTSFWNQALGFGFDEPVTADLLARVCGFYREQGPEVATIQIAPGLLPPDWEEIRAAEGLSADRSIVQLACGIDEFDLDEPAAANAVGADEADQWSSVLLRGFNWPEGGPLAAMMAAAVANPAFRSYAVWEDGRMVAVANLFVHGEVAVFSGAATLPEYRGRGAQSALLAVRARAAADAGCRWITAQTGAPQPGTANHSLNNMLRGGLRPLYDRPSWIWRREPPAGTP